MDGRNIATALIEEREEELPQPIPLEIEEAKEIYQQGEAVERAAWFIMGFAASCVECKYGEASIEEFAREVDESVATVNHRRRVYQRVMSLEDATRLAILRAVSNGLLSYSSLLTANKLPDEHYADVLESAVSESWSKRRTSQEVAQRVGQLNVVGASKDTPSAYNGSEHAESDEYVEVHEQCPHCDGSGSITKYVRAAARAWKKRRSA